MKCHDSRAVISHKRSSVSHTHNPDALLPLSSGEVSSLTNWHLSQNIHNPDDLSLANCLEISSLSRTNTTLTNQYHSHAAKCHLSRTVISHKISALSLTHNRDDLSLARGDLPSRTNCQLHELSSLTKNSLSHTHTALTNYHPQVAIWHHARTVISHKSSLSHTHTHLLVASAQ